MILPDGDFIDLDWLGPETADLPIILILHGLEGSSDSHYVRGLTTKLEKHNVRSCVMHFRGCSGEPNQLARSYHGGETGDLNSTVQHIRSKFPGTTIMAVGYSLGAGILLKWLGEQGSNSILAGGVAVAAPFDLGASAKKMERGASRLYQFWLLRSMKNTIRRKSHLLQEHIDIAKLLRTKTFQAFDNIGTAPVHGFNNATDYYLSASCESYLLNITTPTLVINAIDDPLISSNIVRDKERLGSGITIELYQFGGHIGFVAGNLPGSSNYWLEDRIWNYINSADVLS
tara:strand:+ start:438 stop:1298 length:861 start_codon:yes stop_codon:yes gene_type:complete